MKLQLTSAVHMDDVLATTPRLFRRVSKPLGGSVSRTDLGLTGVSSVQQVTYAGSPVYRFFRDETPGETEGANLNDPITRAKVHQLQALSATIGDLT